MEDRLPAGLWLELLRGTDPDQRSKVLSDAGLRVSVFAADAYPERLPQHIDACGHLVVGEGDPASYPEIPPVEESTTVVPLRRYPRPSQGLCTGEQTNGLLLVLISSRDEAQVQSLRDWADFIHLRWIAAARVPGYTMITPYEHVSGGSPRFCHFYEMTTDDPRKTFESMTPLVMELLGGPESPAFVEWTRHSALRIEYVNTFRRIS